MNNAVGFFENTLGKKWDLEIWLRFGTIILLLLCLFSRICMYLFPKDLWLDEGYTYEVLNSTGFPDLLQGHLGNQSAPLLFVIINKLLITYIGSDVTLLYFLPFICSLISVIILFSLSSKLGNGFYIFFTMLFFSLCFTALRYSTEFKQYGIELLISLLILSNARKNEDNLHQIFSCKNIFFYCVCILCSSSALLFLTGIIFAELIIAWRKNSFNSIKNINYWNIFILIIFIAAYYFLYLKSGNSQHMKTYWSRFMIPNDWVAFWRYWPATGYNIFEALFFGPSKLPIFIFSGLVGGSILLWRQKWDWFLLLSFPVVVTLGANAFVYPPGHGGGPLGGRLLLFLLPSAVLVAAWFYAWVFSSLAAFAAGSGSKREYFFGIGVRRALGIAVVCGLVFYSVVENVSFLYDKRYQGTQLAELVRIFQLNSTHESLNLIYAGSRPAYQYYQRTNNTQPQVEVLGWSWASVKTRLEHLPENQRVLLLVSNFWALGGEKRLGEIDGLFVAQGRTSIKIPAKGAILYILPKIY